MKAKKHIVSIVVVALCAALALMLAGCSSAASTSSSSDTASLNREYMSKANTAMSELSTALKDFDDAAAAGDVVKMQTTADKAFQSITDFKALTPPDDLKSVHDEYSAGCTDLQNALTAYIQLYTDMSSSSVDSATYDSRLASIQDLYNSGLAHLQQGDKMTSEM